MRNENEMTPHEIEGYMYYFDQKACWRECGPIDYELDLSLIHI